MKIKGLFFWIFFYCTFLLSGCSGRTILNPEIFNANPEFCWSCQLYMQAFKAIDASLDSSLANVAANSLIILQMGFLYWLLFKAISLLMSFSRPDLKKEIAEFAKISFKFLIVAIFLNTPTYIYDFFGAIILQPLGEGFLSLSETVLQTPREAGILNINTESYNVLMDLLKDIWNIAHGITDSSADAMSNSHMFGPLAFRVYQIIYQIFNALWHGVGLGFQLVALQDFSAFCAGIFLIAGMGWLLLMMPLYFIDAFLRIGLVMILLPLLMVGWVFSFPDKAEKLFGKVMHTLFGAFFDILFNCIFITFLISLFRVYESQRFPYLFSDAHHTTEGGLRTVGREFGTDFLILIALTFAMLRLAKHVQDFSSFFFGGAAKGGSFVGTVNDFKNLLFKGLRFGFVAATGVLGVVREGFKGAKKNFEKPEEKPSEGEQN